MGEGGRERGEGISRIANHPLCVFGLLIRVICIAAPKERSHYTGLGGICLWIQNHVLGGGGGGGGEEVEEEEVVEVMKGVIPVSQLSW